jgi:hypothetical protein
VPLAEDATDVAKPFAAAVPMPVVAEPEEAAPEVPEETEAVVAKLVLEASALAAAVVEAPMVEPAQPAIKVIAAAVAAEVPNVVPAPAAKLPRAQKAAPKPSSSTVTPKRSATRRPAPSAVAKPAAASASIPALLPRPSMTPAASLPSSRGMAGSAVRAASFTPAPEDMSLAALKAALKVRRSEGSLVCIEVCLQGRLSRF